MREREREGGRRGREEWEGRREGGERRRREGGERRRREEGDRGEREGKGVEGESEGGE
jgi:hypothetical protein